MATIFFHFTISVAFCFLYLCQTRKHMHCSIKPPAAEYSATYNCNNDSLQFALCHLAAT